MPDRAHPDLRRWPSSPAELLDTTRCPACLTRLVGARCPTCGLDLAVSEAGELLELGRRIEATERERQARITAMRAAQAQREGSARVEPMPVGPARADAAPASTQPAVAQPTVPQPAVARSAVSPTAIAAGGHPAVAPNPTPAAAVPAPGRARRSPVQTLLLIVGVGLLAVAAVFFLFVAYLFANDAIRAGIIALLGAAALGVALLLERRRLHGTAEALTVVSVVLVLLDTWFIRSTASFGSGTVEATAWAGGAFLVIAAAFFAFSRASGLRSGAIASSLLAPIGAGLLAGGLLGLDDVPTGLGTAALAAALTALAEPVLAGRAERLLLRSAGFTAGILAAASAVFAAGLPGHLVLLLGGTVFWLAEAVVLVRARASAGWIGLDGALAGATASGALALAAVDLVEPPTTLWLPLLAAAPVVVLAAVMNRARVATPAVRLGVRAAGWAAAAVAGVAALPAIAVAAGAAAARLIDGEPFPYASGDALGWGIASIAGLVIAAVGATVVLSVLRLQRRLAAVPSSLLAAALLAVAGVWPGELGSALAAVVVAALALAAALLLRSPAGVRVVAIAAIGVATGYAVLLAMLGHDRAAWVTGVLGALLVLMTARGSAVRLWPIAAARRVAAPITSAAVVLVALLGATAAPQRLSVAASGGSAWLTPGLWAVCGASLVILAAAFLATSASWRHDALAVLAPAALALLIAIPVLATGSIPSDAPRTATAAVALGTLAAAALGWQFVPRTDADWAVALVRGVAAACAPITAAVAIALAFEAGGAGEHIATVLVGASLAATTLSFAVVPPSRRAVRIAWLSSAAIVGVAAVGFAFTGTAESAWLALLVVAPVPLLASLAFGDPFSGRSRLAPLAWASAALLIAAIWTRLAAAHVAGPEPYTASLAGVLLGAGVLLILRSPGSAVTAPRTAIFAVAAAALVLPSVLVAGSPPLLRPILLVSIGSVAVLVSPWLPAVARGVPIRPLMLLGGAVAAVGGGAVRSATETIDGAVAGELWLIGGLFAVAIASMIRPPGGGARSPIGGWLLAATVAVVGLTVSLGVTVGEDSVVRPLVLLVVLGALHVWSVVSGRPPLAGPLEWSALGTMLVAAVVALIAGVTPFEIATTPVALTLLATGAIRLRRSATLGSWPALGPGLGVLLLPALLADYLAPELWRLVALGAVALAVMVAGLLLRLQAPFLAGASVLLVHAITQLWPWIVWLYEAVFFWVWLSIAGVILVFLAASYERRVRDARAVAMRIGSLR